jgi:alkylmercury lyase
VAEREQIERLANQLIAAVPKLDPDEQTVALALMRMLAKGEPVSDQAIAGALRVPESRIRETVGSWPGVFRDERDRVIGFMGLGVLEFGDHRIYVDGRALSAWCAWDTLFLPELLGQTARVRSRCPTTGEVISMTVGSDGPTDVRPAGAVLSLLAPERPFDADVVRSFCHFVHFLASEHAAAKWTARNPGTFTLSIEDGYRLGQLTNKATFGRASSDGNVAA